MKIKEFLSDKEWDAPFFKVLAHNDTGQSSGHQGGMVLPKDLRKFLPVLDERTISSATPTIDLRFQVKMFIGLIFLTDSTVRYQYQSWHGTRTPESRITDGLGPLRSKASAGDLLIFQRHIERIELYRLILIGNGTSEFRDADSWVGGRKWGSLFDKEQPVTQSLISQAHNEILDLKDQPFESIKTEVSRVEQKHSRIARSYVFRNMVLSEYNKRCAVSKILIVTPDQLYEIESAHVIPLHEGGSDDVRNGIALTQTLHWAFDHGLFGILPNRNIYIPEKVKLIQENAYLRQFENNRITEARTSNLRVHSDALDWHFNNRVKKWDS